MKLKKTIAALLAAFIVIITLSNVSAQTVKGYLALKGTVKIEHDNFAISKVKVFVDGTLEKIYDADKTGKFAFNIDLNKQVVLEICRQGFYSKKLEFNTNVPVEDVGIWNYKFSIELLPEVDGFDATILNQPIGKIKFVERIGDFDYDEAYTAEMQKRLKSMMKDYEQKRSATFQRLIAEADAQFSQANYEEAVELYTKAIDVDPYDSYPDNQIIAIKKILAKNQNNDNNYQKNIAIADQAFNTQQYSNAQIYYKRALTYKDEQYPKDQLLKIDRILSEMSDANAALLAREQAYKDAISEGDKEYAAKHYENALARFGEAAAIKPNEQYPKDKINELNAIIAKLQDDAANKAAIEKAYTEAITQADNLFNKGQLAEARTYYVKAKEIKPAETYPQTRINTIDNQMAAAKANGEKYDGFISVGDQAFANKEYQQAKSAYQQASSIKPNEAYPKQRIAEIDKIVAENAAKKTQYNAAITKADKLYKEQKWADAEAAYREALAVFPTEQYPQDRINDITNRLLAMKNAEEQQRARDKAYADAVRKGDSLLNLKLYQDSKNSFNQALAVKATENYPKQKIAEIDKLLAQQKALDDKYVNLISFADDQFSSGQYPEARNNYVNASQLKPAETYPKERIAEIDKRLAEQKVAAEKVAKTNTEYNNLISQADAQFNAKAYAQAKTIYSQASAVKPDEIYPKNRIVEIDNLMAKAADEERQYNQAITTADGYFGEKKYTEAISAYNQALAIRPNEAYPKQKINEAQSIINAENQKRQQFASLVAKADNLFNQKDYANAKPVYQQALQIMPNEQHPQNRIQQIDMFLADAAKQKAEQENQIRTYKAKVAEADRSFNAHDYDKAIELYNAAKAIKPDETYPDQQIAQINTNIKNEKEQERLAKIDADYKNAITQADNAFKVKDYSAAIGLYRSAAAIKPAEKYPKDQIELCEKRVREANAAATAEAERQRKEQLAAAQNSFDNKKNDFDVPTGQRSEHFLNDLAKKYPEGVTTENYDNPNKKVKRVIVNRNGLAHEYLEVKYSYGTYYFRDGRSISSQVFYKETK